MVEIEPTTKKTHGLPTTPFVKVVSGVLVCLTTCKMLTEFLPKLSLTTTLSSTCDTTPQTELLAHGTAAVTQASDSIPPSKHTLWEGLVGGAIQPFCAQRSSKKMYDTRLHSGLSWEMIDRTTSKPFSPCKGYSAQI